MAYVKLICIDCEYERIVEVPSDGRLTCPKCGRNAVLRHTKNALTAGVESVLTLYGRQILADVPRFCALVADALPQDHRGYLESDPYSDFTLLRRMRDDPQCYAHIATATQADYECDRDRGFYDRLTEALYEALGVETVTKREREKAYVPPTPPPVRVPVGYGTWQDTPTPSATKQKKHARPSAPPAPKPAATVAPKPTATVTPAPTQAFTGAHRRFVLPKGRGAEVQCTLDASVTGWEKGSYTVRFRAGYPCTTGENPKDAVLEIARWGSSGSLTVKTGHVDTVRRVFVCQSSFRVSDLVVEFSDGTPSLLVSVSRSEQRALDQLLEIARHNGRA